MFNLNKYFEKFKLMDGGRGLKVGELIKSVNLFTKLNLVPAEISIKDNFTANFHLSPIKRTEILMSKSKILSDLALKGIAIKDLR